MAAVDLEEREWNQVLSLLSQAPWNIANPLLMRIGQQLRTQSVPAGTEPESPSHVEVYSEKPNSGKGRRA